MLNFQVFVPETTVSTAAGGAEQSTEFNIPWRNLTGAGALGGSGFAGPGWGDSVRARSRCGKSEPGCSDRADLLKVRVGLSVVPVSVVEVDAWRGSGRMADWNMALVCSTCRRDSLTRCGSC